MPAWLTPEAADRLRNELAALTTPGRTPDSAEEDLTWRHERETRIQQIRDLLDDAVIGQEPPDDGVAKPGMVLTVRYDDTGDTETFLLGIRGAENGDLEVYSPDSPLGAALTGARQGDRRTFHVPSGAVLSVTLLRAVPYGRHRSGEAPRPAR
ncbi:transcription elongation factor GreA [Actinomadura sp. NBRC 104412]|uniref:GreA/GreB family elongation factor n=1 Tax=Actinomadura sp. NBRC 104412 TaxID=3032203 RepID=UPI0024A53728|nr:GreA/GreB family elongation factor [Actinomadura sp. NBRC 104412]GLZ06245.1 transcription elongation factor GreA [Actinomadura sp. NBRC 104412]